MHLRSSRFRQRFVRFAQRVAVSIAGVALLGCVAETTSNTPSTPDPSLPATAVSTAPDSASHDRAVPSEPSASGSSPVEPASRKPRLVGRPVQTWSGETYVGARQPTDDPGYDLRVDVPHGVRLGDRLTTRIVVTARPNWKINLEYPVELDLTAATGVLPARQTVRLAHAAQATEDLCEFRVDWQSTTVGAHEVAGELRFGMCRDNACIPVREPIFVELKVSDDAREQPRNAS